MEFDFIYELSSLPRNNMRLERPLQCKTCEAIDGKMQ